MGKIMGKLKHNDSIMHFQNFKLCFFTNNASFGHFHQVSMSLIAISTFSKFQVKLAIREKLQQGVSPTRLLNIKRPVVQRCMQKFN